MAQEKTQHNSRTLDIENTIVNSIDNGILVLDDTLGIHHYNRWLELNTQLKKEDVLGKNICDIFANINKKTLQRKVKTALRLGSPTFYTASTSEYLIPIKIDELRASNFAFMQQDVSIIPIETHDNLVALIITNQTQMINANALLNFHIEKEKELNRQLKDAHEKILITSRSAAMGDMVSMIAHQWRQPLSLINTLMATLQVKNELGQLDAKSMLRTFDKISTTTNYLSDTIDDFRGYFQPNKQICVCELAALFEHSLFFLKDEMENKQIEYLVDLDKSITITTYKNELLQSVINILKNSLDAFEKSDTTNKQISVTLLKKELSIFLYIEDNAGGIAPEVLTHLFEPYYSTKGKNGTGLGLYMCYTIIREHLNGNITIRSKEERTTVEIELPYKITQGEKL